MLPFHNILKRMQDPEVYYHFWIYFGTYLFHSMHKRPQLIYKALSTKWIKWKLISDLDQMIIESITIDFRFFFFHFFFKCAIVNCMTNYYTKETKIGKKRNFRVPFSIKPLIIDQTSIFISLTQNKTFTLNIIYFKQQLISLVLRRYFRTGILVRFQCILNYIRCQ